MILETKEGGDTRDKGEGWYWRQRRGMILETKERGDTRDKGGR